MKILFAGMIAFTWVTVARADAVIATVPTGTNPNAIASDSVTNRVYVANYGSNNVTVINGATDSTTTVTVGTNPNAIAVNTLTNKIYVANYGSGNITVIDGTTNSTTTVTVGTNPIAIAINTITNMIYVANYGSNNVSVINGVTDSMTTVSTGTNSAPQGIAVNPVTNKIYVANVKGNNVTIINGVNSSTITIPSVADPYTIAVNTVTNKVYVNSGSYNIIVIDGATDSTTTVTVGTNPNVIAVNILTNKIYVANYSSSNVTIVDGATDSTDTVTVGTNPSAIAVNTQTNKIYVANYSNNVGVINGATNLATFVNIGTGSSTIAANTATNKIYVNSGSNTIAVIEATPIAPILISPSSGVGNQSTSLTLSWGTMTGAASYSVLVSTSSTFSTMVSSQTGMTGLSEKLSGLTYYTTFYWETNSSNIGGTSSWSSIWSFTTAAHLTIPLSNGWFMYSLNVHPTDSSSKGVFGALKGFILAMDGSDNLYWPGAALDEIGTIHTGNGYWVFDTLPTDTLNLTGGVVSIDSTPISLRDSSWSMVGYLPQVSMPITTALGSIAFQFILAIDGNNNFYWPAASLNEIGTMHPGNGYYIITNSPATLTYPAGNGPAKHLASAAGKTLLNPPAPTHYAKRSLTGNFAAFMAQHVEIGGKVVPDNCEVGAYDTKGNLVGSGTVINGMAAFAICGKDPTSKTKNGCVPSEKIAFKLWNGKTEYPLTVTRGSEPVYTARTILSATLAVPAGALISAFNLTRAYPNPFKGSVNIAFDVPTLSGVSQHAVEIDIFDMKGSLVKQLAKGIYQAGHYELPWNCIEGRDGAVGSSMYIVRMKAANFEKRLKLVRVQ